MRNSKGITLIALTITIIVLLILAGVSLSFILGNEGILGKATSAVDKSKVAGLKEEVEMAVASVKMGYYTDDEGKNIFDYMKDKLNGYETGNGTIDCDEAGKVTYTGNNETVGGMIDSEGNFEFDKIGIFLNPKKLTLKIESETIPTGNIAANLIEIDGDITWRSSDPNVATITGTGKNVTITAVAKGTATITASCGSYSDTCAVIVKTVPVGLGIGSEVMYSPSGTYEWKAEYATSYTEAGLCASINQTLNSGEGGDFRITKWRILDIDEETETVKMVPVTPTTGTVTLQGAQGYNNAVKLLNDACNSLYASEGVTARSIAIEDFEGTPNADGTLEGGIFTPEAIEARNNYENNSTEKIKYGEKHTTANASGRNSEGEYTTYRNYPVMYERETNSIIKATPEIAEEKETNLGLSKQTQLIERSEGTIITDGKQGAKTASTSIHPKQTYYYWDYSDFRTKFKNYAEGKTYENIVLPSGSNTRYWVASRCVNLYYYCCYFEVSCVNAGMRSHTMAESDGIVTSNCGHPIFPVVSLSSELISGDGAGNFVVE